MIYLHKDKLFHLKMQKLKLAKKENGSRILNRRLFLVHTTHINKTRLEKFLLDKVFGEERTTESFEQFMCEHNTIPPNCTYTLINFGFTFDTRNLNIFDYRNKHPDIIVVRNDFDFCKVKKYLESINTNENEDEDENLKHIQDNDSNTTILKGWGKIIFEECMNDIKKSKINPEEEPSPIINWIYDKDGNNGKKLRFIKYVISKDKKRFLVLLQENLKRECYPIIKNAIHKEGWTGNSLIINLTGIDQNVICYNKINTYSSGVIIGRKGECENYTCKNIIVLADWIPNFDLLKDINLRIRKVNTETQLLKDITLKEAQTMYENNTKELEKIKSENPREEVIDKKSEELSFESLEETSSG